jgi:hypothetical protein
MQPVQGIHHITAFASDPQANKDRQYFHSIYFRVLPSFTQVSHV